MYESIDIIPRNIINHVAEVARTVVPEQCNGSFIIPFPAGLRVLPWLPIDKTGPPIVNMQLVGLLPSQQIALHADASIAPAIRYHVVLRSNDRCWSFTEDGKWIKLHEGLIYKMDPAIPHGAVNWGDTLRLHLMIDVEPVL